MTGDATPSMGTERGVSSYRPHWGLGGLVLLFAVVLLRTAWLSEDAYFTFRSVDNFVEGYGMRWNVTERVQVYTHPLWMFLLSAGHWLTRNIAATAFALCFACSFGAVVILVSRVARSNAGVALALGLLIASKAFMDYSTSGLENPLSHLLLVAFAALYLDERDLDGRGDRRRLFAAGLLASLLACNRLDLGLVLAPALLHLLARPVFEPRRVLAMALGFVPLIAWELLSLVYYGSLVPNTAHAKLGAGATTAFKLRQGTRYFSNSLEWDPVTLVAIAIVCVAALLRLRARPRRAALALGALLYLAYVFQIGGDYMSGRFFSGPLMVAAALLAHHRPDELPRPALVLGVVALSGLAVTAPNPTLLSGPDYGEKRLHTDELIDDERGYRYRVAGLLSDREGALLEGDTWYEKGRRLRSEVETSEQTRVVIDPNGGYFGYAAGPKVHIINPYAISDPLLARLPGRVGFVAPGHFWRHPPAGYPQSVLGENNIADPDLRAYWQDLSLIVSGPLFAKARWSAIWRMHTGANTHLIDAYLSAAVDYASVSTPDASVLELRNEGVTIVPDAPLHGEVIEIYLERDDLYGLELRSRGEVVYARQLGRLDSSATYLQLHRVSVPAPVAKAGYDEFRVLPLDGGGVYRMGSVRALSREQVEREKREGGPARSKPTLSLEAQAQPEAPPGD